MRQSDAELECSEWFFSVGASELLTIRDNYLLSSSVNKNSFLFNEMKMINKSFDVVTKYGHSNAIRHRRILNAIILYDLWLTF